MGLVSADGRLERLDVRETLVRIGGQGPMGDVHQLALGLRLADTFIAALSRQVRESAPGWTCSPQTMVKRMPPSR